MSEDVTLRSKLQVFWPGEEEEEEAAQLVWNRWSEMGEKRLGWLSHYGVGDLVKEEAPIHSLVWVQLEG
jgi:hypothetical protein